MLFASFNYHISPSFPSPRIEELKHVLDSNGASEVAASGEGWLKEVNLVVTNSMRFEGWEDVKERNESRKEGEAEVYIVTDKWVDRSLVLGKTQSYVLFVFFFLLFKKILIID
jgi:mediator of DNA damage checkpoint protein 1